MRRDEKSAGFHSDAKLKSAELVTASSFVLRRFQAQQFAGSAPSHPPAAPVSKVSVPLSAFVSLRLGLS